MKTKNIPLRDITIDKEVLIRSEIDKDHLEDLVDAMKESKELPPVVVFADGENFILVDGLHRYRAAQKCNWDRIEAKVHEGSKREATLFACGVNAGHGLRRTNEDKHRAASKLLTDNEWNAWTDAVIAKHCAVSQVFVWKLRKKLTNNGYKFPKQRTGLNKKKYNTSPKGRQGGHAADHSKGEANSDNNEALNAAADAEVERDGQEPHLHSDIEISNVNATFINLKAKLNKLNQMIQEKQKWSDGRRGKARALKEAIDKHFIAISQFLKPIIF